VVPDAELEAAVRTAVECRFLSAGQTPTAAERLIDIESIADQFTGDVVQRITSGSGRRRSAG
jgi:acyl-CoA reductase-like NAD-dependent aldehyde dehydrogenase